MKLFQWSLGLSELQEFVRNENLCSICRPWCGVTSEGRGVAHGDLPLCVTSRRCSLKGPPRHLLRQRPVLKRTGQKRHDNVILTLDWYLFSDLLWTNNKDGFFISSELRLLSSSRSPLASHHRRGDAGTGTTVTTTTRCSGKDLICVSTSGSANHVSLGQDYWTDWPMTDECLGTCLKTVIMCVIVA